MPTLPLLQRIHDHDTAAITAGGTTFSYPQLCERAGEITASLLCDATDLDEARVSFLIPPGFDYVATLLAIWQAGGVAVPLSPLHAASEWEYLLSDADVSNVVAHPNFADKLRGVVASLSLPMLTIDEMHCADDVTLPPLTLSRRAMILYTSGTTNRPKGVVTTHGNLQAQFEMLVQAWEWNRADRILHVLPLHHVHGIVNALLCALWAGAHIDFLPGFDAGEIWRRFQSGNLTLFMGVPTMYYKLIAAWEAAPEEERRRMSAGCASLRLQVSGSAALPVGTLEKWRDITGHVLLERYGMTEIGMALSNPLHGERVAGHVGRPLPTVAIRRVDDQGNIVAADTPGEIEVRGPSVFHEYWRRPRETAEAYRDGWFRTGDVAVVEDGHYRLLGRKSVDIIKSGGYKISALEIEEVLRNHPAILECAVVGAPDEEWGECVSACVVLQPGGSLTLDELRQWAKEHLAIYKVPKRLMIADDLPRNALGKVKKPAVKTLFADE